MPSIHSFRKKVLIKRIQQDERTIEFQEARNKELKVELKTICELCNQLIDENKALKEFILSMANQISIIVKKL